MLTKITVQFRQLPIGSYFMDGERQRILFKIAGINKDDVELNCMDMAKGMIFNFPEDKEVFWLNVGK